jgi:hypothetical protein
MTTTNAAVAPTARKTSCPVSRAQFTSTAKALTVAISGQPLSASPKQFSTGSFGFYANGKVTIVVDGQPVQCQVSLNITVIGSKDLRDATAPEVQAASAAGVQGTSKPAA